MSTKSLPFMSVVVCAYNGESGLARALESLLAQDYPKSRFEIIVVDDGSVDTTAEIASRYPVRLIRHPRNLGTSAARSTGLKFVNGEVYVCFDHDLVVEPSWLRNLAKGYEIPDVLGVGSVIAEPDNPQGVVDRFAVAVGSGNPATLKFGVSKHPLKRFIAYIADQMEGGHVLGAEPYPVRQLNSALASYPVELLRAVGGWDPEIRWMEDTRIRGKLETAFPGRNFYAVPTAKITHDPKMSLATFLKRPFHRGPDNLKFYMDSATTPPVFPFPVAWLVISVMLALINPRIGLAAAIIMPQLLYIWWPIRLVRERNFWCLLFPYLQLGEEGSTVLGLVRGYVRLTLGGRYAQ